MKLSVTVQILKRVPSTKCWSSQLESLRPTRLYANVSLLFLLAYHFRMVSSITCDDLRKCIQHELTKSEPIGANGIIHNLWRVEIQQRRPSD